MLAAQHAAGGTLTLPNDDHSGDPRWLAVALLHNVTRAQLELSLERGVEQVERIRAYLGTHEHSPSRGSHRRSVQRSLDDPQPLRPQQRPAAAILVSCPPPRAALGRKLPSAVRGFVSLQARNIAMCYPTRCFLGRRWQLTLPSWKCRETRKLEIRRSIFVLSAKTVLEPY